MMRYKCRKRYNANKIIFNVKYTIYLNLMIIYKCRKRFNSYIILFNLIISTLLAKKRFLKAKNARNLFVLT